MNVCVCVGACVCVPGGGYLEAQTLETGSEVEDMGAGANRWVCSSGGLWMYF